MGKKDGLPARVYRKHGAYYYVDYARKWHRLGKTEAEMYRRLGEVLDGRGDTISQVLARYERDVLPKKAASTQKVQRRQLGYLREVFGAMRLGDVKRKHIARYLDQRSSPTQGNREIALLSHAYTKAIRWGLADDNPCRQVERNKEKPDDRYITDTEFMAVYRLAPGPVRDAMAIAYITGQRQADVLSLSRSQLSDDGIEFKQAKTGARVLVEWTPALRKAVNRSLGRRGVESMRWVILSERGQRYTSSGFQTAWQKLMRKAVEAGAISERFTFRAIRAKARSDGDDKYLLGHVNPDAMARIYQRKARRVRAVR